MLYVDTERVIQEVSMRACLWDVTDPNYKNRTYKQYYWLEVAKEVIRNFEELNEMKKMQLVIKIQQRWKNAKDSYNKAVVALKNGKGKNKAKRIYLYYDQLRFLDKSEYQPVISDGFENNDGTFEEQDELEHKYGIPNDPLLSVAKIPNTAKSRKKSAAKKHALEKAVEKPPDDVNSTRDDDIAFFHSLLPMVRELSTYDKMVFRAQVMNNLLIIHQKNSSEVTHCTNYCMRVHSKNCLRLRSTKEIYRAMKGRTARPAASSSRVKANRKRPPKSATSSTADCQPAD